MNDSISWGWSPLSGAVVPLRLEGPRRRASRVRRFAMPSPAPAASARLISERPQPRPRPDRRTVPVPRPSLLPLLHRVLSGLRRLPEVA
ncbi:hypothetical protein NE857_06245 [Nocardiopsis exhalans]|uniref:Uncharacterized protein n=1 Tax=Nocardiopsis exhalans TaxID=163604 RepID=A0ABY5DDM5_9ACTN|nr:hypothetical protein [Nocardiopsis exhalans]USY21222.1 hypothetical protein NE857_06245 [Nocardiopsis exhalans]